MSETYALMFCDSSDAIVVNEAATKEDAERFTSLIQTIGEGIYSIGQNDSMIYALYGVSKKGFWSVFVDRS